MSNIYCHPGRAGGFPIFWLTLILAGLTFIRFFGSQLWAALGYVSLAAGLVIWGIGLQRYLGKLQHYQAYVQEERGERSEQNVQTH